MKISFSNCTWWSIYRSNSAVCRSNSSLTLLPRESTPDRVLLVFSPADKREEFCSSWQESSSPVDTGLGFKRVLRWPMSLDCKMVFIDTGSSLCLHTDSASLTLLIGRFAARAGSLSIWFLESTPWSTGNVNKRVQKYEIKMYYQKLKRV